MNNKPATWSANAVGRAFIWMVAILGITLPARAGVYLSSTTFSPSALPYVYTNESLPQPYRLRVKFSNGYHAVNGWNNNYQTLEGVPGTGAWGVDCYWVKYASDGVTITEIGPFYHTTVNIASNTPPLTLSVTAGNTSPGQNTTISGTAYDQDGNMQWLYFYVSPPGYGWLSAGSATAPGTNASGSVAYTASTSYPIGTWAAHVRAVDSSGAWDSNANIVSYFSVKYNQSVSSEPKTIYVNDAFQPTYYGGAGTGVWQFVVAGYTNWGGTQPGTILTSGATSVTWTPTAAGTYYFYIQKLGDATYNTSPPAGPYALTVSKRTQPAVYSQPASVSVGQAFTPAYSGGGGTGAWQFVVAEQTNWGGTQQGTLLGANLTPSSSWVPSAAGTYTFWVRKLGDNGYVDSNMAGPYTLTVATISPTITSQPQSVVVGLNQTAAFTVGATGAPPLYYQWRKNGVSISGATTATYSIAGVTLAAAGAYDVQVSNSYGSVLSASATLSVNAPPVITSSTGAVAPAGTAFSYSIVATNNPTGFGAANLPVGLSVNSNTGVISGTPTQTGTYIVSLSAWNGAGTGTAQLTFVVTSSDPNSDSDGDGVPNGVEALLGANPNSAGQSGGGVIGIKVNSPAQ